MSDIIKDAHDADLSGRIQRETDPDAKHDLIDQIRRSIRVSDFVARFAAIESIDAGGRNYKSNCPRCKQAELMINNHREIIHCFNCGLGGNVFTYHMTRTGANFGESVIAVARAALGYPTPEEVNV